MTAPLIYRCHFSRIDGIRWYSLCRARRTHTATRASCIFRRRPAQQKLDNCIIIRWEGNGERDEEKNTERKGEWKSAVTDTRFGDPQKIVSADSLTYQCYRLADSQLFIAHLAMAEDLRSIPRWSWIRSFAGRGESTQIHRFQRRDIRPDKDDGAREFCRIHARATCKGYVMYSRRYHRRERIQFDKLLKTIHFRTKFLSMLEIHVQTTFAFRLNNWSDS